MIQGAYASERLRVRFRDEGLQVLAGQVGSMTEGRGECEVETETINGPHTLKLSVASVDMVGMLSWVVFRAWQTF